VELTRSPHFRTFSCLLSTWIIKIAYTKTILDLFQVKKHSILARTSRCLVAAEGKGTAAALPIEGLVDN
jgi:hypothetical protein